jgi:hypothetical protein
MWYPPAGEMMAHDGASAFLLLSWREMFDPRTVDTYQPPLSHSASLADELLSTAERASTATRWTSHVAVLQEELAHSVDAESTLLDELPLYHWTLVHLSQAKSPVEIVALARTLQEHHAKYEQHAVHRLRLAADGLPQEKSAATIALQRVATIGVQSGRDATELRNFASAELLGEPPKRVVEAFVSSIHPQQTMFECVLAMKGEAAAVQQIARKAGFRLLSQRDLPSDPKVQVFIEASAGSVYVAATEPAPFSSQAVRQASRRLRQGADVYNFFKNAPELVLIPVGLALDAANEPAVVRLGEDSFSHLKPRKHAAHITQRILDVRPERLSGRVLNALEHFALARLGSAQKVQLVNLWSAIECLAGSSRNASVISGVCDAVAPILMWRKTEKVVRYVARCLQRLRVSGSANGSIGEGFPGTLGSVSAECLLLTISQPKDHPHLLTLLNFCSGHPLLVNRIFSLWSTFRNPRVLAKELRLAERELRWYLWRTYRARNLIVHEGVEVPHVPLLLNQLHFCFATVLSRILHGMSLNETWGVDESIAHWKAKAGYVLHALDRAPARLRVADFFVLPERRGSARIWPSA